MKNLTILSLMGLLTLPALADSSDDQTSPKSVIFRPGRRPVIRNQSTSPSRQSNGNSSIATGHY